MKPPALELRRARSVDEALAELAEAEIEDVKIIAGGQSLMPLMALRMATPARLVDVNGLDMLDSYAHDDGHLVLGALIRHRRLAQDGGAALPIRIIPAAASHIGHVAIRNRGTLGGSLAHADPAAELCAVVRLLRATLICSSAARGPREIAAEDFFSGPYSTALAADEMLLSVRIPLARRLTRYGFVEFAPRSGDYARCGAVCQIEVDTDRSLRSIRAVVFGSGFSPVEIDDAQGPFAGHDVMSVDWQALSEACVAELPDSAVSGARRNLAQAALRRAFVDAMATRQAS